MVRTLFLLTNGSPTSYTYPARPDIQEVLRQNVLIKVDMYTEAGRTCSLGF
jgi:hypothetical protein